jgi:hypothetical protein
MTAGVSPSSDLALPIRSVVRATDFGVAITPSGRYIYGMADSAGSAPPPSPHQSWSKAAIWLGVVLVLSVNAVIVLKSCRDLPGEAIDKTGKIIEKAGRVLVDVVSAFNQGRITTEFISYASSISPTHRLQFATLRQTEIFTRKDEASTGFGYIPLPDVVVEARAPVEFTYYLDLNARWQILVKDNVIHVLAPEIKFNQPAVDVSAIHYEVRKDSAFRNTTAAMDGLKQSITQLSKLRARENVNLIRETGRRQTVEFVEKWLMKSFTDGKDYPVKVFFPGEKLPEGLSPDQSPLPRDTAPQ